MSDVRRFDQQNLIVLLFVQLSMVGILWLASHTSGVFLVPAIVGFSFLGLSNYALMHEACHSGLNGRSENTNWLMGTMAGWMFPVSFTFMNIAHRVHHSHNRTDNELFDYYYPHDNKLIKFSQWYSILIGIYPPIIPLGSLLMAIAPWVFWMKPWQTAKSSSIIFDRSLFPSLILQRIRLEVVCGILFWIILFTLLQLDFWSVLWLYLAFWFNWSTRQYVTHAFSERDVMNGAHNLRVSRVMAWVLLNGHWDLVHHNHPFARWQTLPELGRDSRAPISYWRQYFKQWLGPRPCPQVSPKAIEMEALKLFSRTTQ
ncbi:MAG: fatty acid desaturase [Gammaproteobacteria bacterium]|nr:fatty acid desaturase [Gammaproteobacteria bacterium]MDH5800626.1 fatty acid desaturase [Gammaproteobacteria bacterium]